MPMGKTGSRWAALSVLGFFLVPVSIMIPIVRPQTDPKGLVLLTILIVLAFAGAMTEPIERGYFLDPEDRNILIRIGFGRWINEEVIPFDEVVSLRSDRLPWLKSPHPEVNSRHGRYVVLAQLKSGQERIIAVFNEKASSEEAERQIKEELNLDPKWKDDL